MINVRSSEDRGHIEHGWLDTYHTFSFANYFDPAHMGFKSLRVINEDRVIPGEGFDTHSHKDMEIITYILEGALQHKDSMGNGSVIRPGEVQYMSAGTGVSHSEFNSSDKDPVHLLQIWILPNKKGHKPSYDQKNFSDKLKPGVLTEVVSPDGKNGSICIHQDAKIFVGRVENKSELRYSLKPMRSAWIQVTRGRVTVNGNELTAGDGAEVTSESSLLFSASEGLGEFLLFDLI
jgi:redox-sensitive bicupin YhaK (pirin superfamily)